MASYFEYASTMASFVVGGWFHHWNAHLEAKNFSKYGLVYNPNVATSHFSYKRALR